MIGQNPFKQESGKKPEREIVDTNQSVYVPVVAVVVPWTQLMCCEDMPTGIFCAKD